jgi:hypothetical protein
VGLECGALNDGIENLHRFTRVSNQSFLSHVYLNFLANLLDLVAS